MASISKNIISQTIELVMKTSYVTVTFQVGLWMSSVSGYVIIAKKSVVGGAPRDVGLHIINKHV
jgi:hypothetical protein